MHRLLLLLSLSLAALGQYVNSPHNIFIGCNPSSQGQRDFYTRLTKKMQEFSAKNPHMPNWNPDHNLVVFAYINKVQPNLGIVKVDIFVRWVDPDRPEESKLNLANLRPELEKPPWKKIGEVTVRPDNLKNATLGPDQIIAAMAISAADQLIKFLTVVKNNV